MSFCAIGALTLNTFTLNTKQRARPYSKYFPPPCPPLRDIAKFITQFIVEEIDENTSLEDLQKMMAVALVYRVLVCIYEVRGHPCLLATTMRPHNVYMHASYAIRWALLWKNTSIRSCNTDAITSGPSAEGRELNPKP